MLEVITPGLHTTIQDGGRAEGTTFGVPISGACDPVALAAANLLLGNEPTAPAIEATLVGPELRVLETTVVALAGADFEVDFGPRHLRLWPGTSALVRAGDTLSFGQARDGARTILALPGGIDVPVVLGSASTAPVGGFGGIEGRPLAAGDRLRASRPLAAGDGGRSWPGPGPASGVTRQVGPTHLRVLGGPHLNRLGSPARATLFAAEWTVDSRSDRIGVRLSGPALSMSQAGELVSLGMVWGAVQVPPGGSPIVLLADHATVGGYPVPAVVISADWPSLGQLRPGDRVRFARVNIETAQGLRRDADRELTEAASRLRMEQPTG